MKRFSDEELIYGLKKRDNQTLQYIYSNYYDPVRQLIISNNGSDDDAEDVFQEALIIVFKRLNDDAQFELTSAFKTYIYSICRLIWLKKLREQRKLDVTELKREMEEYIEFEEPPPVEDKDLRLAIYQRNLLHIPEDCQHILRMTAENIKSKDIADKLGFRSESYVRKRRHFCKEFLVNKIKEDAEYRAMFDD